MKKVKLFCILACIGAVMLSVTSSCKKTDYGDDIAQLKNDVAELNNAIKAGKTVTAVTPITGGNKLTFSDGTSMDIMNGADGVSAFTPILGVDAEGYWTVVTTDGGTAVRVKDANSKDVKAVASYPTVGANGNWFIDGKDSGVSAKGEDGEDGHSPYICTNAAEGTLNNWMVWNGTAYADSGVKAVGKDGTTTANVKVVGGVLYIDGVATSVGSIESAILFDKLTNTLVVTLEGVPYRLPLAKDVVTTKTITGVMCPEVSQYIGFSWGKAARLAATEDAKRKAFTGKNAGDYFFKSDAGSFLVNPTEVDTEGYGIELVDPKDNSMVSMLSQEWVEFGYEGSFVRTKVKAEGGLWTLKMEEPSKAEIAALVGDVRAGNMNNLAVKVMKGDYTVRSAYQYSIGENPNSLSTVAVPAPSAIPTVNCGDYYDLCRNLFAGVYFDDLYKWEFSWSAASSNQALKQYVTIDGAYMVIDNSAEAVNTVGGKTAEFQLRAVDYNGNYYEHLVKVAISKQTVIDVRLSKTDWTLAADNSSTPAVTTRENVVNVPLQKMFDEIVKYGAVKTSFTFNDIRVIENGVPVTDRNFVLEPYVKGTTTGSSNIVSQGDAAWSSLNIVFDVTKALPVDYSFEVTYENSNAQMVRVIIPVKVVNPVMDWSKLFVKNDLFAGDKIKIYGDSEAAQQSGNASYDLSKAFSTVPAAGYFDFKYLGSGTSPLSSGKICQINAATVGVESKLGVVYYYFTNKDNVVSVPGFDFYATPRSFVADGSISLISGAKSEVTYDPAGGDKGSILMSATYVAKTVYGKTDLKAFGNRDALIQGVSVYPTGVNSNLITVTPVGNDFRIGATNNAAGIATATVDLVIRISDKMGKELYTTVKVTVKN